VSHINVPAQARRVKGERLQIEMHARHRIHFSIPTHPERRCSVTRRQALPMWTEAQLARSLEQPSAMSFIFYRPSFTSRPFFFQLHS